MRRADRLFRIVQLLRSGRLQTGAQLAAKLEISLRTLYRDIADLQASGVLIEGEPGLGYTLRRDMDLPPMQFTADETTALVLGLRMAQAWGGAVVATAAKDALGKVEAVLPERLRADMDAVQMYAPGHTLSPDIRTRLDFLHGACVQHRIATFRYHSLAEVTTMRRVRPLALAFWGGVWVLVSWDEHRENFRSFRVDRIADLAVHMEPFKPRRGQTLKDFLRREVPAASLKALGIAL